MKKNTITLMSVTFLTGILFGMAVIGLYSFSGSVAIPNPSEGISRINTDEAKALFRNYFSTAAPSNEVVKGFGINREQLAALNALANENPELSSFRIYMGYDNSAGNVSIIVGVNGSGADQTNSIYRSYAVGSGPCPTICDGKSAIIGN